MSYDDNKLSDIEDLVVSTINELEDDIPIDETINSQPLSDTYLDDNFKNNLLEEIKEEILEEQNPTDFLDNSNEKNLKVDTTQKTEIENPTPSKTNPTSIIQTQSEPAPQTPEVIIKNGDEVLIEIREKIATLFEGLKSNEIQKPEDKLNLTLKYLEYILEMLDAKIE
jgi:uncharacterized Zn-finger protein